MSSVEKLSIALTQDQAAMVREAVRAGGYASSSEVVRDALRLWQQRRAEEQHGIERLRTLAQAGIASGMVPHDGMDAIKATARAR